MQILSIYLSLINALALLLMLADKQRAKKHRWRIPESVLLASAALGGSLGALLGMWLGQRIRSRLSPQRFRQGFLLFLLALGIELIARGWLV